MLNRRTLLKSLAGTAAASTVPLRGARADEGPDPRYLIVIGAMGGASINDCFMALRDSECASSTDHNVYPDAYVEEVGPFRCVEVEGLTSIGALPTATWSSRQKELTQALFDDLMVATLTSTSVNHTIGQKRSINGNGAWNGRTLQEVVAETWGDRFVIPNVNMGVDGFLEDGADETLALSSYGEPITRPDLYALSMDAVAGIPHSPNRSVIDAARGLRDGLDTQSAFWERHQENPRLQRWHAQRSELQPTIEAAGLSQELTFAQDASTLQALGMAESADAELVRSTFPLYASDDLESQAALAYLLIRNQISCAVTIGLGMDIQIDDLVSSPPLAFDYSHNAHRATQLFLWQRVLDTIARLRGLLTGVPYPWDDSLSIWDRTLVYVATDFGRDKRRQAGYAEFGTGHHLNNGVVCVSPMVKGGNVLGGIDPDTLLTYGFDPVTGQPLGPGDNMNEAHIYAGILGALGVDFSEAGLTDVPAMRRKA